jgi:hypothetical protein
LSFLGLCVVGGVISGVSTTLSLSVSGLDEGDLEGLRGDEVMSSTSPRSLATKEPWLNMELQRVVSRWCA